MFSFLSRAAIVVLLALLGLGIDGAGAAAQTLPQSTLDRQQIMQLQNELNYPSITPSQRRDIEMQIATLEYRINTRPLVVPPPNLAPRALRTPLPGLGTPGAARLGISRGAAPTTQDACSERALLAARLQALERNAPLDAQRSYAREALQRLAAVPCR